MAVVWKATMLRGEYGAPYFASFHPDGSQPFASVNECVGDLAGQWSIKVTSPAGNVMYAYAGSLRQAKRMVHRWASLHLR